MEYQPITAVWEITFACNMQCKHCGSSCDSFLADELTTSEALSLCDDIDKLGLKYLTLSGGEPFLRKDWHLIARRLRDNNVIPVVISNGWFIDEDIIDKAIAAEVSNIAVSMDGLRENHDFMRKKGSFERVLSALDLMRAKGMASTAVTSINKNNIGELPQIKELLIDKGVYSWQVQIAVAMGNMLDHPELLIEPAQVERIIDFAYDVNKEGKIRLYPADCIGYYHCKEIEINKMLSRDKEYDGIWKGCPAGKHSFGIRCNGNIIGCTSIRDDGFIEANVRDIPLPVLWEKEDAFTWNRKLQRDALTGFCGECQYGFLCLGGCTNSKLTMSGTIYENRYCVYRSAVEEEVKKIEEITAVEELCNRGREYLKDKDYQFAEKNFLKAHEIAGNNREIIDYLGFIYFQMGKYEKSVEFNRLSLQIEPDNAYALKGLGNCLVKMGQRDEGIALLKKSLLQAQADFTDPYYDLAVVYFNNQEYPAALEVLQEGRRKSTIFEKDSDEFYQLVKKRIETSPASPVE